MPRCELSDLPVEMCDHCKTGAKTLGDERQLHEGNWTGTAVRFYRKSDRPGRCACGELFNVGDQIRLGRREELVESRELLRLRI